MNVWLRCCAATMLLAAASAAPATFHKFETEQVYSNADGTVQFVVLHEVSGSNGENLWAGRSITSTHAGAPKSSFTFPANLPSDVTAGRRVLVATSGFAALGIVTPDFVVPNGFLATDGGTVNYAGVDQVAYLALPTDGTNAINHSGAPIPNVATNFAGVSASVTGQVPTPGQLQMPGSITFGSQAVGTQSATVTAIVVNIGGTTVAISGVANSNAAEFAIVLTTCTGGVASAGSCQIRVAFQPTAAGARNGTITVTSSGDGSPQSFAVSGTGAGVPPPPPPPPPPGQLQMPGALAFAPQAVDTQSPPAFVSVANIGGSAVTVSGVATSNAAEFSLVTTTCAGSVAAGASCQISVAFQPAAAGERNGTITVTSSGAGSPQSFATSGYGSDYSRDYVQKAYVAYYGRAADPDGLDYWANRMDAEARLLDAIIAAFGNSDEFNRRYGGLSHVGLVTTIYQQALGRDPEQAGLDFYVGELQAGRRTLQSITLDVLNGATTAPDSMVVANKLDVAAYYTTKVAAGCSYGTEQDGVNALSGVTAVSATVTAAKAAINSRCGP